MRVLPTPASPVTMIVAGLPLSVTSRLAPTSRATSRLAADERRLVTEPELSGARRAQRHQLVGGDRLALALQPQRRERAPGRERHRGDGRVAAGEDRADRGRVRQPRGGVHGVADDGVGEGRLHAGQHLAGVEPDPQPEPAPAAELVGDQLAHLVLHADGRAHRPLGVVLVGGRGAEDGHDPVAGQLVDVAADLDDDPRERGEHPVGHLTDALGVEILRPGGEVRQVTEEHGDDAPLGRLVDPLGGQRHAADVAEARIGDGRGRAGGAAHRSGGRRRRAGGGGADGQS